MRLAALFSHPIQYFAPLFRALASHSEVDLTVYFCSRQGLKEYVDPGFGKAFRWDIPLLEGYRHKFLPNLRQDRGTQGFLSLINPAIVRELQRERYDALWVHGYMHATNWFASITVRLIGTPILLRGESHLLEPRPFHIRLAKEVVLRPLLRMTSACLYIGTNNKAFYRYFGVPDDRLFFTPYTVDNAFFRQWAEKLAPQRQAIRARWGISDGRPVILYVGKLVPWKQPLSLLEAYYRVRQRHLCALLYVGDGPMRGRIEEVVKEKNIPDVYITGFLNQTEIPQAYVAGDILVLPSAHEPWGLVVNEGMNFGLPVVVTDRVGCAPDLVQKGKNGYVVPYHSVEALEGALERLVAEPEQRRLFGQRSLEIIQGWGIEQTVEGILQAIEAIGGNV
jgi:glycosyltransferase involved in cell wall biosynthesis